MPLLFAQPHGSPQLLASSTLLRKDNENYLVTAGHVQREIDEFGPPYVAIRAQSDPSRTAIAQFGLFGAYQMIDQGHVQTDFQFLHLLDEPKFFPQFTSFHEIDSEVDERSFDQYCIIGFPASRNKRPKRIIPGETIKMPSCASISAVRHKHEARVLEERKYHPGNHLVLSYSRRSYSREGKRIMGPKPHGMSGGAVYGLSTSGDGSKAYFCGIITEYEERRAAIICTIGGLVAHMLKPFRKDPKWIEAFGNASP